MSAKRVLVVDDEPSLRFAISANLRLDGVDVVQAASAEAALEVFEVGAFDAILTDLRMPGASGVDLLRRVRELERFLPVILMTAFAEDPAIAAAVQAGVFALLRKPSRSEDVAAVVARATLSPLVGVASDCPGLVDQLRAAGLPACSHSAGAEQETATTDVVVVSVPGFEASQSIVEKAGTPGFARLIVLASKGAAVPVQSALAGVLQSPAELSEILREIARFRSRPATTAGGRALS